jgi:hypothetical protein
MLDACLERPTAPRRRPPRSDLGDLVDPVPSVLYSAAQLYEELSGKYDSALAEQGIKRSDVPRAAYYELTRGL